jgi:hypothetical protein
MTRPSASDGNLVIQLTVRKLQSPGFGQLTLHERVSRIICYQGPLTLSTRSLHILYILSRCEVGGPDLQSPAGG